MGLEVIIINLILAIPTFFLCRLIFKKIRNKTTRRIATGLTTLILTPFVYLSLIFIWIAVVSYYPEREFDEVKWRTDVEKRYEMTDDLVDNRKLIGKTKAEITELLGPGTMSADASVWTYYIGFKPALFGIDPDVLEIEFDGDRVVKCWTRGT